MTLEVGLEGLGCTGLCCHIANHHSIHIKYFRFGICLFLSWYVSFWFLVVCSACLSPKYLLFWQMLLLLWSFKLSPCVSVLVSSATVFENAENSKWSNKVRCLECQRILHNAQVFLNMNDQPRWRWNTYIHVHICIYVYIYIYIYIYVCTYMYIYI